MNEDSIETADHARSILDDLIAQRRQMRAHSCEPGLLEANRLGIVYWQLQLARAVAAGRREVMHA
jgi:hypothetical protein